MIFYVIDLDKYEPEQWSELYIRTVECDTAANVARTCAEQWAENPDSVRTYHVGVATKPDGSDLREHIVVSRVVEVRTFEVTGAKLIGSMVRPARKDSP